MILVTGGNGQLGKELARILPSNTARFFGSADLDITNTEALKKIIEEVRPEFLINCAAYSTVDQAEAEPERAFAVNRDAVGQIGEFSSKYGFRVIHFSSDYIFDGQRSEPYGETDSPNPLNVYGRSKVEGEQLLLRNTDKATIIRAAWVYSKGERNFLRTMLESASKRPMLSVVFDQVGSPTYVGSLARAIVEILPQIGDKTPRILHYSSEGVASWYDFAKAIFENSAVNVVVKAVRTEEFPRPAKRPAYSVLDKTLFKNTFNITIPHWREGLKLCLEQY